MKDGKMKITRNNYELFFLDYVEGNFDQNQEDDLQQFLQENPDLKEELSLLKPVLLDPPELKYPGKERLYKESLDDERIFNRAAVDWVEGILPGEEKAAFENYLGKNPGKRKDAALFEKTKLKPDNAIVFADKNRLYRRSRRTELFLWSGRIAAILLLALAFYGIIQQFGEPALTPAQLAEINDTPPEKGVPEAKDKETDQAITRNEAPGITDIPSTTGEMARMESKKTPRLDKTTEKPLGRSDLAEAERTPLEVPEKLEPLHASIHRMEPRQATLAAVTPKQPAFMPQEQGERLIGEALRENTGLENFSFRKITRAGLNLVTTISNEKFNYQTNRRGEITEISFDSRLMAFSIPTNND